MKGRLQVIARHTQRSVKMKLHKLESRSRITEVDTTTKSIYSAFQKSGLTEDHHLAKMMKELHELSLIMTGAIGAVETESTLDESDALRDEDIRSLFYFVKGQCSHPSKQIKASAQVVWGLLDSFGISIVSEGYAIQTSLESSLLQKLTEPSMVAHIAKVPGVDTLIQAVQSSNNNFAERELIYKKAKAASSVTVTATEIKKDILPLINNKLVVYLRAMAVVEEETFGEFTRVVGQLIDDTNRNVRNR